MLKKFIPESGVMRKLNVTLNAPSTLDLSAFLAKGIQPGEQILVPQAPSANPAFLASLMDMGFPADACNRAILATNNSSLEDAMNWLFAQTEGNAAIVSS